MKFLAAIIITFSVFQCRAESINWSRVIDNCINDQNPNRYCQALYEQKIVIESNLNNLFLQNLSPWQKYLATGSYYLVARRVSFPVRLSKEFKMNVAYRFNGLEDQGVTFSYSF